MEDTDQDEENVVPTTIEKTKTNTPTECRTPEATPIYAALLKSLGDPIVRPPTDRSFATLAASAETARKKSTKK